VLSSIEFHYPPTPVTDSGMIESLNLLQSSMIEEKEAKRLDIKNLVMSTAAMHMVGTE
jgi:hypothetical protein